MAYMVIEMQTTHDGQVANTCTTHDTIEQAESKYHTVLAAAAVSAVDYHSAAMLTDRGGFVKSECFTHYVEPEPIEEAADAAE